MFSPRFAGQPRDRALNPDGTPRSCGTLPVLDDGEARWYFAMTPDAAHAPTDELEELDAAHAAEWAAYCSTLTARSEYGAPRNVGARWWCACGAFVSSPSSMCAKCCSWGPHVFGEDSPLAGNATRKARLRSVQRARRAR